MNLLITRHDKIGDFALTLPMIQMAKKNIPDANIIVLVSKVNYDFAKQIDFIDDVILYEENILALAKKIKQKQIDVSISAFIDTKLALALFIARVKTRYAPATKIAQFLFNKRITQRRSRAKKREFKYNIDLLKSFYPNCNIGFSCPLLALDKRKKEMIFNAFKKDFHVKENANVIAFHPGFGGSSDGNLTLNDYIKLAKSISKKKDIQVVFTFGPDDEESFHFIKENIDFNAILYSSKTSLMDFCYLLSNFALFISTSTGPMHLAGILNVQTISFFGDSIFASPKRWGSVNEKQNDFSISQDYDTASYKKIEDRLKKLVASIT